MGKTFLLIALAFLLVALPVGAHTPDPPDPESYVPTVGWIGEVSGDVSITDGEGSRLKNAVGEAIIGRCVIETGSNGLVVLQLEDYEKHQSRLTVESNSKIEVEAKGGKHYDDTIGHRWSIYPHGLVVNLSQGKVHFLIKALQAGIHRYDVKVETPHAEIRLPGGGASSQYPNIEFFASVERSEGAEDLEDDMSTMMEASLSQMAQMGGMEMDEETLRQMQEMMVMYDEELEGAVESGFTPEKHGVKTEVGVITGAVYFADRDILAGESCVVDGINEPVKTAERSPGKPSSPAPMPGVAQAKPAISLNVSLEDQALRPELAATMKTQVDIAAQSDPEMPADMLKTAVWVYQTEGDPQTLLTDNHWPADTMAAFEAKDMEQALYELIDNFGPALEEVWGPDWSLRAEMAAQEYAGRTLSTSTYSYTVPPIQSTTVNVVSPWLDPRTLEIYEGTYIVIIETSVNLGF